MMNMIVSERGVGEVSSFEPFGEIREPRHEEKNTLVNRTVPFI